MCKFGFLGEKNFGVEADLKIVPAETAHVFLCQVGTKKFLRIYKPFIGGQPPVNGLHVNCYVMTKVK